ncbi:alpha/beta fold hydrolase [Pseudobacteriovorax antillogorgiicola]|uniref:Pimeloyl-ACP methyl ester carboxylesterase n=1 Tax=Pseudobacteriovorax antillogorgiicola TaxID=1513793 RepID=A0A1Y6CJ81_9BACT|nr:alpha/beta hydrolase [Pseudobacteriovorax antillogorgiicola]TCS46649.1 pimeloyl-ACP methyl ester carboxylesterase [Pseudobacteriovorax antillogorgiicola]SMF66368.1 Pimeloyl-ACP methyl ester carboxylesterase [Pseudobacteriovorax antillogorgiicola]
MSFLKQGSSQIYYQTAGDSGPWVTLVNGHTRTHKDFKMMSKVLVNAGFRCLSFDNRGSGESTCELEFGFPELVSDVINLWDELDISESHLLGISMGGMICQKLASEHPQRISSLILVSTTAHAEWIKADSHWGTSFDEVMDKLETYFAPVFVEKNKLLVKSMAKQIWSGIETGSFSSGASKQKAAMKGIDLSSMLQDIKARTLILHGIEDQIIDPRAGSELDDGIPNSELKLIDGVGHLLLAEYSQSLYQDVLSFIQSKR